MPRYIDHRDGLCIWACMRLALLHFLFYLRQLLCMQLVVYRQYVYKLVEFALAPCVMAEGALPGCGGQRGEVLEKLFATSGHTA